MDNVYRRDHEMPYIADGAVTLQQKETKKAIREYNEAMPFELEKGMECLERAGNQRKRSGKAQEKKIGRASCRERV